MVSLRDSNFCGVAPSLRSARGQGGAAGGVWGGMPRRPADFFARGAERKNKRPMALNFCQKVIE
jgi:hypothetical protein